VRQVSASVGMQLAYKEWGAGYVIIQRMPHRWLACLSSVGCVRSSTAFRIAATRASGPAATVIVTVALVLSQDFIRFGESGEFAWLRVSQCWRWHGPCVKVVVTSIMSSVPADRFSTQAVAPAFTVCSKYCWFSCMV